MHINQYENWFVQNCCAYQSEIEVARRHLPAQGRGLEIVVGSGLFAEPFGIHDGIVPSAKMCKRAVQRGVKKEVDGVSE